MKIHNEKEYMICNVESPKAMRAYIRYFVHKEDRNEQLQIMYQELPPMRKRLINVLIQDLLPENKRWRIFKLYLEKFILTDEVLKEKKVDTAGKIERFIYAYMKVSKKFSRLEKDRSDIHSSMKRLQDANAPHEDNEMVQILADFFNVSKEVLLTGCGERYIIDYDYIAKMLDNKKIDYNDWVKTVYAHGAIVKGITNKERKNYEFYVNHSFKVFAELASELLNTRIDNLLIVESCWIELIDYPFGDFYKQLTVENQEVVFHVMTNLNLR